MLHTLSQHVHLHCLIPGGAFSHKAIGVRKIRRRIGALLDTLMAADWVVYSKPCLTHTETVVDYLARCDGDRVQLDYKDYRDGNRHKVLTLSGAGLLLHVLPKGFMRIRHFGLLANRCPTQRIEEIRAAVDVAQQPPEPTATSAPSPVRGLSLSPLPPGPLAHHRLPGSETL